jgi:DNA-binding transcriptional regulator YhcF (GntR family)
MLIEIDMHSSIPIYKQLKTAIISGILSGQLNEGDGLPSVRQLASDLSINLHTVRKVYEMLCEEGYIRIHRSKGTEVCRPPKLYEEDLTVFKSLLLPIIIELRARNIGQKRYGELMNELWEKSMTGGTANE